MSLISFFNFFVFKQENMQKNEFFFILGKNSSLSIVEILNYLESRQINHEIVDRDDNFLILNFEKDFSADIIRELGGTIKIGKIIDDKFSEDAVLQNLKDLGKEKVFFGFSQYGAGKIDITKTGLEIKKRLKQEKISSRFVVSNETQLSSVTVKKNHLLDRGIEFVLMSSRLGKTLAIQDFKDYGKRDFGRPKRDTFSGTMPPKLAQILINLLQAKKDDLVLDPFCGSGTILSEALVSGYKNLVGSDISEKAINDSEENLEWIEKNYQIKNAKYELLNLDVKNLSQNFQKNSIDRIIAEPYLGPALRGGESIDKIQKNISELTKLYLSAFQEFQKILKQNGRIVFILPVFNKNNDKMFLPILDKIEKTGFKIIKFDSKLELNSRGTLEYSREGQKVGREILVLER